MSPAYIKTEIVQETVINNAHMKFEVNQKHHLDTSVLLIISLHKL